MIYKGLFWEFNLPFEYFFSLLKTHKNGRLLFWGQGLVV